MSGLDDGFVDYVGGFSVVMFVGFGLTGWWFWLRYGVAFGYSVAD